MAGPFGLRIWDEAGNLVLDTGDRLTRLIDIIEVSADGSITDARLSDGTPFYTTTPKAPGVGPNVSISGNTLSWSFTLAGALAVPSFIVYGIF